MPSTCCLQVPVPGTIAFSLCPPFPYTHMNTNAYTHMNTYTHNKQSSPATRHGGALGDRRYSSYSLLTLAVDGVSGQRHAPAALCPGERTSGTHCAGGWVGLRAGLDTKVRGKNLFPCWGSNPDRPVVQSIVRHYTDRTTPAGSLSLSHTHARTHARTRARVHTCIHMYIHTYVRTNTDVLYFYDSLLDLVGPEKFYG
jgi:hypothetical protein